MSDTKNGIAGNCRKRRPPLNFTEMGIPIGAKLVFKNSSPPIEAIICSDKKVKTPGNDEEKYLTRLTRELLNVNYNVNPTRYWSHEGKSLNAYYNETYTFGA